MTWQLLPLLNREYTADRRAWFHRTVERGNNVSMVVENDKTNHENNAP